MISKNHQDLIGQVISYQTDRDKDLYQKKFLYDSLINIKNPVILEFGVNTGASTSIFVHVAEQNNGHVYSIDIKDCSDVVISDNWSFFRINDLEIKKILENFEILYKGIDVIYVDSYHDSDHVEKLTYAWFPYLKKNGFLFFDDTDNYIYRKKKLIPHTINVGEINSAIEKIYFSNEDSIVYSRIFGSSGLSRYIKITNMNDKLNIAKELWDVNFFIRYFYIYIRKLFKFFKKNN